MCQFREECKVGSVNVYTNLFCNYATEIQIAEYVEWIIRENKEGIFHIGTTDMIQHRDFIKNLFFNYLEMSGTMAVLTKRKDIPNRLEWNVQRVVKYLCNEE